MTLLDQLLQEFDRKFPCLVKPTGFTFTRYGKKQEVEAMTYEKDSVIRFLKSAYARIRGEAAKEAYALFLTEIKNAKNKFPDSKEFEMVVDLRDIEKSLEKLKQRSISKNLKNINQ